jgi:hypothetical protein
VKKIAYWILFGSFLTAIASAAETTETGGTAEADSAIYSEIRSTPLSSREKPMGFQENPSGWRGEPLGFRELPPDYRTEPMGYREKIANTLETPRGFSETPPNFIEKDSLLQVNTDADKRISIEEHPLASKSNSLRISPEELPQTNKDSSLRLDRISEAKED